MSAIEIFQNDDWSIRSMLIDGEPWFVAVDICRGLGLDNTAQALVRLDEDCKGVISSDTPGGVQQVRTLSELGPVAICNIPGHSE